MATFAREQPIRVLPPGRNTSCLFPPSRSRTSHLSGSDSRPPVRPAVWWARPQPPSKIRGYVRSPRLRHSSRWLLRMAATDRMTTRTTAPSLARAVLLTAEAAERLGIPRSTVHYVVRRGELPARRVGRRWLFLRKARRRKKPKAAPGQALQEAGATGLEPAASGVQTGRPAE